MGSLFEELEAREAAARMRVEALEAELAEVSGRLSAAREGLERLRIARETVAEVLAEMPVVTVDVSESRVEGVSVSPYAGAERQVIGVLTVPNWQPGMGVDLLPSVYRDIVEVVAEVRSPEQVIADAFDQAEARDPKHLRPWVVLVDGARHQLDLIEAETVRRGVTVHVLLDFVHVAEYVWAAVHAFHKPGTTEAEAWAADHLTAILAGHAARVADEMAAQANRERLPAARRGAVDACHRYLTGHLDQLHYDTALANGWPIATGAVEGACRHLIADRLDITGARWGLPGAEAVLRLRTLVANGDLDPYWRFHTHQEDKRIYPDSDPQKFALTA